jgi:flagellar export protein FliJ
MPFHFSLQPVLHLRESLEHQQELRLRAANQQVARVRHLIEVAEQRRQERHSSQLKELGAGTTAAELRFGLHCDAELERYRRELEQHLAVTQRACEKQRELFQQAKQAREMLASVGDQKILIYEKESRRRTAPPG